MHIPFSLNHDLVMSRLGTYSGEQATNPHGCHEIINEISAVIDATTIYGDYRNPDVMSSLRTGQHGTLRMQQNGQFLPYTEDETNFEAGDVRAGEHAILGKSFYSSSLCLPSCFLSFFCLSLRCFSISATTSSLSHGGNNVSLLSS